MMTHMKTADVCKEVLPMVTAWIGITLLISMYLLPLLLSQQLHLFATSGVTSCSGSSTTTKALSRLPAFPLAAASDHTAVLWQHCVIMILMLAMKGSQRLKLCRPAGRGSQTKPLSAQLLQLALYCRYLKHMHSDNDILD